MAKIVISERYTKEAKKAIKNCSVIYCAVASDDDEQHAGKIFVCGNGYFIFALTPAEYDAIVRPVTMRDAGNYKSDANGISAGGPNIIDFFDRAAKSALDDCSSDLIRTPFAVNLGKKLSSMDIFYNEKKDFTFTVNSTFSAAVRPDSRWSAPSAKSPAIVDYCGSVHAVILPVVAKENEKINAAMREFCKA